LLDFLKQDSYYAVISYIIFIIKLKFYEVVIMPTLQKMFLSLSGGGIKGVSQLIVLAEMEKITGMPISKLFDGIAGTSVGAIITVALTRPKEPGSTEPLFSAEKVLEMFENKAAEIFPPKFGGGFLKIFKHQYSQKPLKAALEEYAGDTTLGDSVTRAFISAFDVSGKEDNPNKFWDSDNPADKGILAKWAARCSAAAPTYFQPVIDEDNGTAFVDGGLGANRPAASVLKKLKEGLNIEQQREMLKNTTICALNFEPPDIPREIPSKKLDGSIGWVTKGNLVNKILRANEKDATDEVRRDLSEDGQFIEIVLNLPKGCTKLDNVSPSNIAKLKEVGKKYVEDNKELIEKLCATLVKNAQAREESLKLHEAQSVEESSVLSEDKENDNIDKKGQDKNTVNTHVISEEFEAKLAINLTEKQAESLKEGLMKLSPKEYDVLQVFLKGLNDAQLEALYAHLPLIADGNFKNINISELSHFQNKFLKFFSSMFEHEDNIINEAISCADEYRAAEEVACDGRGSEVAHYVDMVY
jgi:uncharacterized protein